MSVTKIVERFFYKRQKELDRHLNEASIMQQEVLSRLIETAKNTEYGVRHLFGATRDYAAFAQNVPLNTYEDLKGDIERSMAVGFNSARLHQKVFEERFHYWADKLGYLTWGESASWGMDVNGAAAARNFLMEWQEVVERDRNHPSIITWTPFNETWGRGSDGIAHDRLLGDVYDLTHRIDYRPVHDVSGGYHQAKTDIWSFHDYEGNAAELKKQLTLKGDGSVPTLDASKEAKYKGQPYFLDEIGGIGWVIEKYAEKTWGYGEGPKDLNAFYTRLESTVDTVLTFDYINGYTYTQLTDVEQEQNGIFTYDRQPKFDAAKLRSIFGKEPEWYKQLLKSQSGKTK